MLKISQLVYQYIEIYRVRCIEVILAFERKLGLLWSQRFVERILHVHGAVSVCTHGGVQKAEC